MTRATRSHAEDDLSSPHVVICGGGIAAVEALLALRQLLPTHPHIDLIAPNRELVYQPMAVAKPFGPTKTRLLDVSEIAADLGAELHVGTLVEVDAADRRVVLADGTRLPYDAAIVAVGARRSTWLEGALSFGGTDDTREFADLLGRLARGDVSQLAFASPPQASWTLPMYELALLTAARLAELGVTGVDLTIVTPESEPLAIFGAAASGMLRSQLSDRGIRLRAGATAEQLIPGRLELSTGEAMAVEEVVALPRLEGPRIDGLPADDDGFILIDDHCQAVGLEDVYAAGDGTAYPVKQGGIATQQADVAAESVAARLGALSQPSVFEPQLRGMLLTGVAPVYMRAGVAATASDNGDVAAHPLWMPATKIAGLHLGPYLARISTLTDRSASSL